MKSPTLAFWERKLTPEKYVIEIRRSLNDTASNFDTHMIRVVKSLDPRVDNNKDRIALDMKSLERDYTTRWDESSPSPRKAEWLPKEASRNMQDDLLEYLRVERMPHFRDGKLRKRRRESKWVGQRLYDLEKEFLAEMHSIISILKGSIPANIKCSASPHPPLLPGIKDGSDRLNLARPCEGPLVLQIGTVCWASEAL